MRNREMIKMKKEGLEIINTIKNEINSIEFMDKSKNNKQNFIRNRKLTFPLLIFFMLSSVRATLQKELTNFMELVSGSCNKTKGISKSAFSQSRSKLNPEAFIHLNKVLTREFYTDNDYQMWKGFRLLGVDGSTIQLPYSNALSEHFGEYEINSGRTFPIARSSNMYDLLNNIILDSKIASFNQGENSLAEQHLKIVQQNDLIILDRGYDAVWLFYFITTKKADFVVRLKKNFIKEVNDFWDSKQKSEIIEINNCPSKSKMQLDKLGIEFKPFKIRLVKVILDNGEIEVLATSLLDENKYSVSIFKELYFTRWGIETNYDHLKNQIEIENFSGLTVHAIEQDFYANMLMANFQSLIIRDAKDEMDKENNNKNYKYEYKINRNLSFAYMKDRFVKILLSDDKNYFEQLKELFKVEPIPVRKGRKFERHPIIRRKKYFINKRRAV